MRMTITYDMIMMDLGTEHNTLERLREKMITLRKSVGSEMLTSLMSRWT